MTNYQECFVNNLRKWRRERGVSQAELAEMCNVSNGTIGNIETMVTKPSFDLILEMAHRLRIAPTLLFVETEAEEAALLYCKTSGTFDPPFTSGQLRKIRAAMRKAIDSGMELL